MVFKNLCFHVLWTKVASALEGLTILIHYRMYSIHTERGIFLRDLVMRVSGTSETHWCSYLVQCSYHTLYNTCTIPCIIISTHSTLHVQCTAQMVKKTLRIFVPADIMENICIILRITKDGLQAMVSKHVRKLPVTQS